MKYTLKTHVHRDLMNQIKIEGLELASVSFNFENERSSKGTAILSVVVAHIASGHKQNFVYEDESALKFWRDINKSGEIDAAIFAKLIADKKLPAGDVVG